MEDVTYVSSRSIDIELGGQEVITIDLDNLDPNPDDVLDLLKEGQCRVSVWTKLAGEYWRRGYLAAAERIAHSAIECASPSSSLSCNLPGGYPQHYMQTERQLPLLRYTRFLQISR
jgi:RNA polymerase-associated protein CTR9